MVSILQLLVLKNQLGSSKRNVPFRNSPYLSATKSTSLKKQKSCVRCLKRVNWCVDYKVLNFIPNVTTVAR